MALTKIPGGVISDDAITADKIAAGVVQSELNSANYQPTMRNIIINGDMRIAQRGTSLSGQTGTGIYLVDRFNISGNGYGTWTFSQDTDVPSGQGFDKSLKLDCTTANASLSASNHMAVLQRIEGQNLQHLKFGTSNAEKLTVSFWVKSNKTGTYTNEFYAPDGPRHINTEFTINSADTWEKKTITIDGDTSGVINNDNGAGLEWLLWLSAGTDFTSGTLQTSWDTANNPDRVSSSNVNLADSTSNYINITGVQLEVGDTATPFEHLPYDVQLVRCMRYYEVNSLQWYNAIYGNAFRGANKPHRVLKRANPTGSIVSGTIRYAIPGVASYSADSNAGLTIVIVSNDSWFLSHTRQVGGSSPSNGLGYYCETNPYIAFDAEL